MPAVSQAQHSFMQMCASQKSRAKAHGKCPPRPIARKFAKLKLSAKAKSRAFDA